MTFDGNDYRKRVLAAVHRRGGPDESDAFELYDVALDESSDELVRRQVDEVWGFWQRSRDHPKYGTLCGLLVEGHEQRSWELLDPGRRELLARRVRTARSAREAARYELLDAAVRRLVERHRGVPRDKVDGLIELGALHGLTADEVRSRLRMHRVVDVAPVVAAPAAAPSSVTDTRRLQVRALLDEFGRLNETPAPPTLFALLGLGPDADEGDLAQRAAAWRERVRELPPLRIRAVADELMVHVRDLLEAGPIVRAGYLDAVAADVTDALRPRVRAAVLVEDRLVADDHDHLLEEAEALGLDPARGRVVLAALAAELGVAVESRGAPAAPARRAGTPWERSLRAARAALREGRLLEAERLAADASRTAGVEGATPARAVSDEIAAALVAARLRWRAATTALGARRFAAAVEHLEHLTRSAVDVPGPSGASAPAQLATARNEVAAADAALAAAGTDAGALGAVLDRWPDHPPAVTALAALPLEPPSAVTAARDRTGTVVISWHPSPTPNVTYRVSRAGPDGAPRVVGRTPGTSLEDGGAPPGDVVPYAVVALLARRASAEARSGETRSGVAPAPPADALPPPADVRATRAADGTVRITWAGPPGAEFKVVRVTADGRRQVVGRTRRHEIEDGGAPAELPTYVITASCDDGTSSEAST